MSKQDRQANRDDATGRIDQARTSRSRELTGQAGQLTPSRRATWPSCRDHPNFVSELVDFGEE